MVDAVLAAASLNGSPFSLDYAVNELNDADCGPRLALHVFSIGLFLSLLEADVLTLLDGEAS